MGCTGLGVAARGAQDGVWHWCASTAPFKLLFRKQEASLGGPRSDRHFQLAAALCTLQSPACRQLKPPNTKLFCREML